MKSDTEWSRAYIQAQQIVESKDGNLILSPVHIRIINTWIRYALTTNKAPEPRSIYFGTFDKLPSENFGSPRSVGEFIEAVHHEQGLPSLTERETRQIELLAVSTAMVCEDPPSSANQKTSSGCAGVIIIGFAITSASFYSVYSLFTG